jgi:hypothetical protein
MVHEGVGGMQPIAVHRRRRIGTDSGLWPGDRENTGGCDHQGMCRPRHAHSHLLALASS